MCGQIIPVELGRVRYTEEGLRYAIVREARSWVYTPFHVKGRVKGRQGGVDCGTFLLEVFERVGIIGPEDEGVYGGDWFAHATDEWYEFKVLRHCMKVIEANCLATREVKPGNVILVKIEERSKVFCHGAIVTGWPRVVHAKPPCVAEVCTRSSYHFTRRHIVVFDPVIPFLEHRAEKIGGVLNSGHIGGDSVR